MFTALLASALLTVQVESIEIEYTERDVVEPARVEMLREQIRRAARDVCDVNSARTVAELSRARTCVADAESRGLDQLRRAVAEAGVIEIAAR